jgi:hypothetical protein
LSAGKEEKPPKPGPKEGKNKKKPGLGLLTTCGSVAFFSLLFSQFFSFSSRWMFAT